jgi:molecular chaperone DnaK
MLDTVAYQVERAITADTPAHERARAEMLVGQAREAVKSEAPLDQVRSLTSELQQVQASLSAVRSGGEEQPTSQDGGDDVIDAEFDRA